MDLLSRRGVALVQYRRCGIRCARCHCWGLCILFLFACGYSKGFGFREIPTRIDGKNCGRQFRGGRGKRTSKTLREHIATANSGAAEAMRIAEQERLARVKSKEKLAWRDLSPEQEKSLSSKMQPFTGQRFKLITFQDDTETLRLTGKIGVVESMAASPMN